MAGSALPGADGCLPIAHRRVANFPTLRLVKIYEGLRIYGVAAFAAVRRYFLY